MKSGILAGCGSGGGVNIIFKEFFNEFNYTRFTGRSL
jgi:hypothetical protein